MPGNGAQPGSRKRKLPYQHQLMEHPSAFGMALQPGLFERSFMTAGPFGMDFPQAAFMGPRPMLPHMFPMGQPATHFRGPMRAFQPPVRHQQPCRGWRGPMQNGWQQQYGEANGPMRWGAQHAPTAQATADAASLPAVFAMGPPSAEAVQACGCARAAPAQLQGATAQQTGAPSDGRAMARRAGEAACSKLAGPPRHNQAMPLTSGAPDAKAPDSALPAPEPQRVSVPVAPNTAAAPASAAPAEKRSSSPAPKQPPAVTAARVVLLEAPTVEPAPAAPLPAAATPVNAAPEPVLLAVSLAQDMAMQQQPSSAGLPAVLGTQAGSMQEQGPAAFAGNPAAAAAWGGSEATPAVGVPGGWADVPVQQQSPYKGPAEISTQVSPHARVPDPAAALPEAAHAEAVPADKPAAVMHASQPVTVPHSEASMAAAQHQPDVAIARSGPALTAPHSRAAIPATPAQPAPVVKPAAVAGSGEGEDRDEAAEEPEVRRMNMKGTQDD